MEIRVDRVELSHLARDLRDVDKTLRTELLRGVKQAIAPIVDQAKANASFSTRIPAAIRPAASFPIKNGARAEVKVNAGKAPHARPLEGSGRNGSFRHPVFGHKTWVTQPTHPFLFNAADGHIDAAEEAILEVMDVVSRKAGFR